MQEHEALMRYLIESCQLNLERLSVYTEGASGHYMYAPVLTALAGAERVYAQVNSHPRYGKAEDVIAQSIVLAKRFSVDDRIVFFDGRRHDFLAQADIVTNSANVRPIDASLVDSLKSTAVIPLMWETWEYRSEDFDLPHCRAKGVLVLGTKEDTLFCDMAQYLYLTAMKLLFSLQYDGGRVLLLGNSPMPGLSLSNCFSKSDIPYDWFSYDGIQPYSYSNLKKWFFSNGHKYTHILVAEHMYPGLLFGSDGLIDFEVLKSCNPFVKIGVISGHIKENELKSSGIEFLPVTIRPFSYMTYMPSELGIRPVLNLFCAGLKVGEQMARQRLNLVPPREAAEIVLGKGLAMDFPGELSWMKN
jgi:hypothetical protein